MCVSIMSTLAMPRSGREVSVPEAANSDEERMSVYGKHEGTAECPGMGQPRRLLGAALEQSQSFGGAQANVSFSAVAAVWTD